MTAPAGVAEQDSLHEEEALGKAYDARLLRRLWRYVAPYRAQIALTLLLVAPMFALELAPAWIVKTGLDQVIAPSIGVSGALGAGGAASTAAPAVPAAVDGLAHGPASIPPLVWLGILYLVAMLASSGLQYWQTLVMAKTGQLAMRTLRSEVFAHISRLHLGFFDRMPVGRLVTRATNDVENVAEMFSAGVVALLTDLLKMVGFAVALFLVNAKLALVTFLVVPLLAGAAIVFRLRIREAFRSVRVRIARINAMLQETVTGMKVVQLFRRESRNMHDFAELNAAHRDAWAMSIRYDAALFAVVEMAGSLSVAIIIWYGTGVAAAGVLYVFIDWMRRFFLPLRDLSAKYSVMQSSMASCERIFQLLDTEPAVRDATPRRRPAAAAAGPRGAVALENVWFAYNGEDWILKDVSLRVEPGEKVALVGATGAGKTSIIKLLTRFYDVGRGRVLLDGVDLRDLPQEELRHRVALVQQDVFLFSGSVAENISLGRSDIDLAAIERAARAVEAHGFISALPEGYQTNLHERGANFSGGQRQLLSFARALAHGADVLVLDEATSSIDTETEALIQQALRVLWKGKTALVIAHRLSTIQDVDRIHVLHHGRIVESGRHEELLARRGVYHRLYRLQYETQKTVAGAPATGGKG